MDRQKIAQTCLKIARIVPLLLIFGGLVLFGGKLGNLSAADILSYTPQNLWLAGAVLVGLYAVKSLSVVFPLLALYISAGMLFPLPAAFLVNTIGLFCCICIPYALGRFSGKEFADHLLQKYKSASRLREIMQEHELFAAYILRIINLLPGDIVSMVLGASGMRPGNYLLGSMLGLLPTMIATTVLGDSITDPSSAAFRISLVVTVLFSVGSAGIYTIYTKRKHR